MEDPKAKGGGEGKGLLKDSGVCTFRDPRLACVVVAEGMNGLLRVAPGVDENGLRNGGAVSASERGWLYMSVSRSAAALEKEVAMEAQGLGSLKGNAKVPGGGRGGQLEERRLTRRMPVMGGGGARGDGSGEQRSL